MVAWSYRTFSFRGKIEEGGLELFFAQAFRHVGAGWVFSVHVARVSVCAVSASSAYFAVFADSAFAFEKVAVLEAAVEWRGFNFFPGVLQRLVSDVAQPLVLGGCEVGVEAWDEVAVLRDRHVAAESEVGAFAMELVLVPFVEVGDVAHFDDAGEVGTVDVDFEFALVFFGEVPNVVEHPLILFRRGGKISHFLALPLGTRWLNQTKFAWYFSASSQTWSRC